MEEECVFGCNKTFQKPCLACYREVPRPHYNPHLDHRKKWLHAYHYEEEKPPLFSGFTNSEKILILASIVLYLVITKWTLKTILFSL